MEDTKMPSLENALKALLTSYGFTVIQKTDEYWGHRLITETKAYDVCVDVTEFANDDLPNPQPTSDRRGD